MFRSILSLLVCALVSDSNASQDSAAGSLPTAERFIVDQEMVSFYEDFRKSFVDIYGGTFPKKEFRQGKQSESTQQVTVGDFQVQKHEVTQLQWLKVMGTKPSQFRSPEHCEGSYDSENEICPKNPVESIFWSEAQEFIRRVNLIASHLGFEKYFYRLLKDAEWEYVARGGHKQQDPTRPNLIPPYEAWLGRSPGLLQHTKPVALLPPNPVGVYDIFGNVGEWVEEPYYDPRAAQPGDTNEERCYGIFRMARGNGYWKTYGDMRWNYREGVPDDGYGVHGGVGFRVGRYKKTQHRELLSLASSIIFKDYDRALSLIRAGDLDLNSQIIQEGVPIGLPLEVALNHFSYALTICTEATIEQRLARENVRKTKSIVLEMLKKGALPNGDRTTGTPVFFKAITSDPSVISRRSVHSESTENFEFARRAFMEVVEGFLSGDADPNSSPRDGNMDVLAMAAYHHNLRLVSLLLENGASPTAHRFGRRWSPLFALLVDFEGYGRPAGTSDLAERTELGILLVRNDAFDDSDIFYLKRKIRLMRRGLTEDGDPIEVGTSEEVTKALEKILDSIERDGRGRPF